MTDLTKLAQDILNGDTLPFGSHGVYDSADWIDAAQQALDPVEQDFADLRHMVAEEAAWERFSTTYRGDIEFSMSQSLVQQARDIAADQYIRLQMKEPNQDQSLFTWARHIQQYSDFMRGGSYDDNLAVQATLDALRSTSA